MDNSHLNVKYPFNVLLVYIVLSCRVNRAYKPLQCVPFFYLIVMQVVEAAASNYEIAYSLIPISTHHHPPLDPKLLAPSPFVRIPLPIPPPSPANDGQTSQRAF